MNKEPGATRGWTLAQIEQLARMKAEATKPQEPSEPLRKLLAKGVFDVKCALMLIDAEKENRKSDG